jgi:thymidylate synthase (FAD)
MEYYISHGVQIEPIKCLDHGYVKFIESYGSDEAIIRAARMSTGKGFLGWGPSPCKRCGHVSGEDRGADCCPDGERHDYPAGDEKLLKFLGDNHHDSPFEFAGMVIEVQAPIFVFREWHRHRTQSYSEISSRYSPLPDVNYIPSVERLMMTSKTNKQAGVVAGADELNDDTAERFQEELENLYEEQEKLYQWALKSGVPKELARVHLPVGRYSSMRASANLRNWLAFLTLREAPNAQYEIRQFAHAVASLIGQAFPRTHGLYVERRGT